MSGRPRMPRASSVARARAARPIWPSVRTRSAPAAPGERRRERRRPRRSRRARWRRAGARQGLDRARLAPAPGPGRPPGGPGGRRWPPGPAAGPAPLTRPSKERRFELAGLSNRGRRALARVGGRARSGRGPRGVAVVALLPLYGDVRPSALVSHAEWARLMLRGLDLLADAPGRQRHRRPGLRDALRPRQPGLARRTSTCADSASRPSSRTASAGSAPRAAIGEAVYAVGIARQGDYRLRLQRLRSRGGRGRDLTKAGRTTVLRSLHGAGGDGDGLDRRGHRAPRPGRLRRHGAPARGQRRSSTSSWPRRASTRSSRAAAGRPRPSRPPRTWR